METGVEIHFGRPRRHRRWHARAQNLAYAHLRSPTGRSHVKPLRPCPRDAQHTLPDHGKGEGCTIRLPGRIEVESVDVVEEIERQIRPLVTAEPKPFLDANP